MKILVVSKVPIFPVTGGNRSRIKTFCDECRNLGYDLSFLLLPSWEKMDIDIDHHKSYFGEKGLYIVNRHAFLSIPFLLSTLIRREIGRLKHYFGMPHAKSNNVDYRFDKYLRNPIKKVISNYSPDILIIEYVHFSSIALLAPSNCVKIIDTHDSFEHEFTTHAEKVGLSRADYIIAIQQIEANRFQRLIGEENKVRIVSHIVPETSAVDTSNCEGFSFVGSNFDANNISLRWLYERVLPIVFKRRPDCRLFVAGTVGDAIPDDERVIKLGRVDNLHAIYSRAPILANAICKGTGVKIKLLEAMSNGVSVVSTRLGVAGIDERFLTGVAIVNDFDATAFADHIISLFDNRIARSFAGQSALSAMLTWNSEQRGSLKSLLLRSPKVHT